MADQRKYNAHLNRKGLDQHITVEQAGQMARHQGSTYLFIVAAHAGPKMVGEDGSEDVALIPDLVELVPVEHEERIRAVQRAFYLARPEQHGQPAFDGAEDGDAGVTEALNDADALVERDATGEVSGVWDGDPDEPLGDPQAVEVASQNSDEDAAADGCPFPDCVREEEHDGPHRDRAGHILGSDVGEDEG